MADKKQPAAGQTTTDLNAHIENQARSIKRLRQLLRDVVAGNRKSGGRLSRSEVVTIRLDPKLRYLADLASRKQRRTLSSFIEWAIEQSLAKVEFSENSTIADSASVLWDVDDCDRFVKLALRDESLLNYDEQILWKRLKEEAGITAKANEEKFDWKLLRRLWSQLISAPSDAEADKVPAHKG